MTLILVLANSDQVVMIADRRLSVNGRLVDDESNKAALLQARDARMLVGYTGVAAVGYFPDTRPPLPTSWQGPTPDPSGGPAPPGAFRTSFWMLEALLASAPPDHLSGPIIDRFAERASDRFDQLRLSHPNKGVLFCFVGYTYQSGSPQLVLRSVTNFVDRVRSGPDFRVQESPDGRVLPRAFMYAYGATNALDPADMDALGALVSERRPARALVGKAVEVLQTAAASARAGGVIGHQINSAILPADPTFPAQADYHSAVATNSIFGMSVVEVRGGEHGLMIISDPLIRYGTSDSRGPSPAVRVPTVGRNVPCPCKSGKKFKHCHGRT